MCLLKLLDCLNDLRQPRNVQSNFNLCFCVSPSSCIVTLYWSLILYLILSNASATSEFCCLPIFACAFSSTSTDSHRHRLIRLRSSFKCFSSVKMGRLFFELARSCFIMRPISTYDNFGARSMNDSHSFLLTLVFIIFCRGL
jgi:hypothetical protein